MTEHTPGPWTVRGEPDLLCVTDTDGRYIVDRFWLGKWPEWQNVANARLIAGAPDLLEACEQIAPLLGGWREVIAGLDDMPKDEVLGKAMWACLDQIDEAGKLIRAAIAKAQGQA